jgi:hypothetical protein
MPFIMPSEIIDNDSFEKYKIGMPVIKVKHTLDLRSHKTLSGIQLLSYIQKAASNTRILLPSGEIRINFNLEITKPLFLQGKPGTRLILSR